MIRMIQSKSAAQAKSYFAEALQKADYYLSDQELNGTYRGSLAMELGLSGPATKEGFFALCDNRHPHTGAQLTPRTKEERTTGYDINFHCPKSVSIVHALSKDDHVLEAFRQSVLETMAAIESDAKTRVRTGNTNENRNTGNLLYIDFIHHTARPVADALPDPHLHAHLYTFNITKDPVEQRIKAAQFRQIKRDMPYYQSMFHKRLADKLVDLGYQIKRTKSSFELEGVPQRVIDLFSKRTDEIGRMAKEKGITDAKALDELGAKTRSKKQKGLSMDELKKEWRSQIRELDGSPEDFSAAVRYGPRKAEKVPSPEQCLTFSLGHHFEKASVVPARRILATAYREALGAPATKIADIDKTLNTRPDLIHAEEGDQHVCTTAAILNEERRMVALAKSGRGKCAPLYEQVPDIRLKGKQRDAITHVLSTTDTVSIVRGAAGTGKTTLMQEAVSLIERAGKRVTVVAPTASASRGVLREEGFEQADTVALLLASKERQKALKGQVLWVDEAGMLGTGDMLSLLEIAREQQARLILGGDTRQHASVVRGDALRVLNKIARIRPAEVTEIHRQKDERYKAAVKDLSDGKVASGFGKLDAMGTIVEIDKDRPNAGLIQDYIEGVKKGKNIQVISPVNTHRKALTEELRAALRKEGLIGKREATVSRMENLHLSGAEKENRKCYQPGQYIQFTLPATGFPRGSRWEVVQAGEEGILLRDVQGKTQALPKGYSNRFDVLQKVELKLSKHDQVVITRNGYDLNNKRLDNGSRYEVDGVSKDGRITLRNRQSKQTYQVDSAFGHLDHAVCITSYASQGKTVDEILVAQPAETFPGTNAKQFYVSASRARESVRIYTDDKAELLAHASRTGDRTAALEITPSEKRHNDHMAHLHRSERDRDPNSRTEQKQTKDRADHAPVVKAYQDYEPNV